MTYPSHLSLIVIFIIFVLICISIRFIYYLMATASIASCNKNDFEDEISKTKKKIETYFCQLMDCLRDRKEKLMKELDSIL